MHDIKNAINRIKGKIYILLLIKMLEPIIERSESSGSLKVIIDDVEVDVKNDMQSENSKLYAELVNYEKSDGDGPIKKLIYRGILTVIYGILNANTIYIPAIIFSIKKYYKRIKNSSTNYLKEKIQLIAHYYAEKKDRLDARINVNFYVQRILKDEYINTLSGTEKIIQIVGDIKDNGLMSASDLIIKKLVAKNFIENVTEISLNDYRWINNIIWLNGFGDLTSVSLTELKGLKNAGPLKKLRNLLEIDLSYSRIERLNFLSPNILRLKIEYCSRINDITKIGSLKKLRYIDVSCLEHLKDFRPLSKAGSLISIHAKNNIHLTKAPEVKNINQLYEIDLSYCKNLQCIKELLLSKSLRHLTLDKCKKISIIDISRLDLLHLSLNGCNQDIDSFGIGSMKNLQYLDIRGNKLIGDSAALVNLDKLTELRLDDSMEILLSESDMAKKPWENIKFLEVYKIKFVPTELLSNFNKNCAEQYVEWMNAILRGYTKQSTIKLFVIGNSKVGKTQITRRLTNKLYDPKVPSTHGISINNPMSCGSNNFGGDAYSDVNIRIWDFGGQDIYLGTHELFMDQNVIYIVAWNETQENNNEYLESGYTFKNNDLSYWLDYVSTLTNGNVPIIITKTKNDLASNHGFIPSTFDCQNLKNIFYAECNSIYEDGLDDLREKIEQAILCHLDTNGYGLIPDDWKSVILDIAEISRDKKIITKSDYVSIYKSHSVPGNSDVLLNFLHNSGVLFFKENQFAGNIVLDQSWLLEGVYSLFDPNRILKLIKEQGGIFSRELLKSTVWQDKTEEEIDYFLSMMLQCKACINISPNKYVAINLLPEKNEVHEALQNIIRNDSSKLRCVLEYNLLHDGIKRSIICSINKTPNSNRIYWNSGLCFYDPKSNSSYIIEFNSKNRPNTITIECTKYSIETEKKVEYFINLIKNIKIGKLPKISKIAQIDEPIVLDAMHGQNLSGVKNYPRRKKTICVSMGGQSESQFFLQSFRDEVCYDSYNLIVSADNVQVAHNNILDSINEVDHFILLISEEYLRSLKCMAELLNIFQHSLIEGDDYILDKICPIIVDATDISGPIQRSKYIKYWEQEFSNTIKSFSGIDFFNTSSADKNEVILIQNLFSKISDIIHFLHKNNRPSNAKNIRDLILFKDSI